MKARIEIFCQADIGGLETGSEEEIRKWLIENGYGDFFFDIIQVVEDDQELNKERL